MDNSITYTFTFNEDEVKSLLDVIDIAKSEGICPEIAYHIGIVLECTLSAWKSQV